MKFTRMKDIATHLQEVSEDTGYDYDYLCERVEDQVRDGDTYNEAVDFVTRVSYEKDW